MFAPWVMLLVMGAIGITIVFMYLVLVGMEVWRRFRDEDKHDVW